MRSVNTANNCAGRRRLQSSPTR